MFGKNKIAAQELMDKITDKYKGFENQFWDTKDFKITIVNANRAIIRSYSMENIENRNSINYKDTYEVKRLWYHKIFGITMDRLIEIRRKKIIRMLQKENLKQKLIIDLKQKYEN